MPLRSALVEFAATATEIVALPFPDIPDEIFRNALPLVAVHGQFAALAVSVTASVCESPLVNCGGAAVKIHV